MKSLPRLLSLFLALMLVLGVFAIAPVSAAESGRHAAAIEKEEENIDNNLDEDETDDTDDTDETEDTEETDPDETDETDPDETDETEPAVTMAAPVSLQVENIDIYDDLDSYNTTTFGEDGLEHSWRCYEFDNRLRYTVTLEDGTTLTSNDNGYVTYNGTECTLEYDIEQTYENQWGYGKHTVEFGFYDVYASADITVHESPIKSIDVKNVVCKEGSNGSFTTYYVNLNEETGEYDSELRYFRYDDTPEYTVTLKDNTEIKSEDGFFTLNGVDYGATVETNQHASPWHAGVHDLTATIFGKEYPFTYTITQSDIKDVSVENVTCYEGIDADVHTILTESGEQSYNFYNYNPRITITLQDDTKVTKALSDEMFEYNGTVYQISYDDQQDEGDIWGYGDHDVLVTVADFEKTVTVTVKPNPVNKITVSDIDVYKGVDSASVYDEEAGEYWDEYSYQPSYSVLLSDGTTIIDTDGSVVIDGNLYTISFTDDQSYEKQWEVGNSYKVQASIGVYSAEFTVNVRGDIVSSVRVLGGVTVTEGVDAEEAWDDITDVAYTRLSYDKYVSLEITMYDGTKVTANEDGEYIFKGRELPLTFTDNQSPSIVWTAGTYTASVSVGGVSANFTVTVEATPAKSVAIANVRIVEGMGIEDGAYVYMPAFTVEMADGRKLNSDEDFSVFFNGQQHYLEITDNQSDSAWGVGTHTATGTIMGISSTFTVEIISSPVDSVEVESTLELYENGVGQWETICDPITGAETGEYFRYEPCPVRYTVYFKNGDVVESDEEGNITYLGNTYKPEEIDTKQDADNQWTVGTTYTATAKLLGCQFSFSCEIKGSPVKNATFTALNLIEGADSYTETETDGSTWTRYNCDAGDMNFKLTLKNGKTVTGEGGSVEYNDEFYEITSVIDGQSVSNQWKAGSTYDVKVSILGYEATVKVTVLPNPVAKVTVKGVAEAVADVDGYTSDHYEGAVYVGSYFYYEAQPTEYTVTLTDGKVLTSSEDGYVTYKGRDFQLTMDPEATLQDYYNQWEVGETYPAVGRFMGKPVNYSVKVVLTASTKIKVYTERTKLKVGDVEYVEADVENPVGKTTYRSSNTAVATVTSGGKVVTKKAGKVTITATNNGVSASVTYTVSKRTNPAKITASKKTVKYSALKKKAQTVKAVNVKSAQGKVTYAKASGDKKITVNKKTGKLTLKKGMKKKTYAVKVKVKVAGNTKYNPVTKTVTVKITVR